MTKNQLLNLISFNLIMGCKGLFQHSPSYIEEKCKRYLGNIKDDESWKDGLHPHLIEKIEAYLKTWKTDIEILDRSGKLDNLFEK